MSERRWELVSVKFAWAGLLVSALCLASGAFAQGQSGAAAPGDAAGHSQNSSAAKTPAGGSSNSGSGAASSATTSSSSNSSAAATSSNGSAASGQIAASSSSEPEMVDQSAPAGDSLAEAARQARARKAKAGVAGANAPKVYTEDKLSQLSGHGVSVVGDGNAGGSGSSSGEESSYSGAGADSGASAAAGAGSNGEEYWRGRARAIRDQMAQCDQEISKLQDEIAKYGAVSVDPQSGAMQSIIYVNDRNAKIKQIQDRRDGLQGQLDALEDEGRKAGADAGWFR